MLDQHRRMGDDARDDELPRRQLYVLPQAPFMFMALVGVATALTRAVSEGRTQVVCVRTKREENHSRRVEIREAVVRSVREALGTAHPTGAEAP